MSGNCAWSSGSSVTAGEFVLWDVGLGAAANALTALRATRDIPCSIHLLSFDHTLEPLAFALQHREALGYLGGYEAAPGAPAARTPLRLPGRRANGQLGHAPGGLPRACWRNPPR